MMHVLGAFRPSAKISSHELTMEPQSNTDVDLNGNE
jgi:hypothetical protein